MVRNPAHDARNAAILRALALGLWALVLLRSCVDGRLDLLLRRSFHPLVALSGVVLLLLALLQARWAFGSAAEATAGRPPQTRPPKTGPLAAAPRATASQDEVSARSRRLNPAERRDGWTALATARLAALLLALPPNPSFADLAAQRPRDEGSAGELSFVLPPAQRSLTDWVRLLRSQPDPALFDGDPVRISGFVLPTPNQPPQLARLLVRCCLADATPVGLPVRWPAGGPPPEADQWLAIEGRMALEPGPSGASLVVVPSTVRSIARPRYPLEP
ncbi:TIGR03943 family putative permease subunit [Vulcanococcus limneticus]|uniref:TIGR03943 family putative permease subunit n=1 Tax=Vulcanococcus limneticus TaxID=2170428 RepID=UPI00398BDB4C